MKPKSIILVVLLTLAIVAYVVRRQQIRRLETSLAAPYGRFTSAQIVERTRSLCSLFWPQHDTLILIPDTGETYKAKPAAGGTGAASSHGMPGTRLRVWTVTCQRSDGYAMGQFCWNADSGKLICFGADRPEVGHTAVLNRMELLSISRQWIGKLGWDDDHEKWLLREVQPFEETMLFRWTSPDHIACLSLDRSSGQLVSFRVSATEKTE